VARTSVNALETLINAAAKGVLGWIETSECFKKCGGLGNPVGLGTAMVEIGEKSSPFQVTACDVLRIEPRPPGSTVTVLKKDGNPETHGDPRPSKDVRDALVSAIGTLIDMAS